MQNIIIGFKERYVEFDIDQCSNIKMYKHTDKLSKGCISHIFLMQEEKRYLTFTLNNKDI